MKKIKLTYTVMVADTVTAQTADRWLWEVIRESKQDLPQEILYVHLTPEIEEEII